MNVNAFSQKEIKVCVENKWQQIGILTFLDKTF